MTNLFKEKVTIYNDIPETQDAKRTFSRFVITQCNVSEQIVEKADSTIRNLVNTKTVTTKDIEHYKSPVEYFALSADERKAYYTVHPGDFVVFGEVADEVADASAFLALQKKYKDNGIKVISANAYIHGMAVDNVSMTNV